MDDKRRRRDQNNGMAGIVLIIAGCLLLAYKMGFDVPNWIFSWQMLLIVLGILSGIKNNFRGAGWIVLLSIGGLFLVDRLMPDNNFHDYIFPLAVIGAGVFIVFRPKNQYSKYNRLKNDSPEIIIEKKNDLGDEAAANFSTGKHESPMDQHIKSHLDSGDSFRVSSIFSGVNRNIFSKNFQGGSINCVFGGAEIDLTQADIQNPVTIKIEQVFGGTKLIIPSHWTVQNQVDGVFHSVEDKRKRHTEGIYDPAKLLIIKGSSVFAGVEIKSY